MSYDNTFQAKIWPVFRSALDVIASGKISGKLYRQVPSDAVTLPCIVYQSQDGGGKRDDRMGDNGWEGFITFRSISYDADEADNNLIALANEFQFVTASGFYISIIPEHPVEFPVEKKSAGKIYTSGLLTRVKIRNQ